MPSDQSVHYEGSGVIGISWLHKFSKYYDYYGAHAGFYLAQKFAGETGDSWANVYTTLAVQRDGCEN